MRPAANPARTPGGTALAYLRVRRPLVRAAERNSPVLHRSDAAILSSHDRIRRPPANQGHRRLAFVLRTCSSFRIGTPPTPAHLVSQPGRVLSPAHPAEDESATLAAAIPVRQSAFAGRRSTRSTNSLRARSESSAQVVASVR